jgi:2-amino-4-hydroxy-6-hydroxymethyldihydropteridine diphosphokinase
LSAESVRAFIGLGSNLGDRPANFRTAVAALDLTDGVEVIRTSRVYETDPIGPPQPQYLNAVVEVRTTLAPRALLEALLRIEAEMGRVRGPRWGPRVIDLDLLDYGRMRVREPGLVVPHPRMHERAFALIPLLELEPDPLLPGRRKAGPTLRRLGGIDGVRLFGPPIAQR